ncbi:MAG TPA: biotin--[acetyl-CoA-carboxylase] ligase [Chthoniobacteraceae bacterium]
MNPLDVELLRIFRGAAMHQQWSHLSEKLAAPVELLTERVQELRGAGFSIEEHPTLGLRLVDSPDRLIADDLLARLGPCETLREIVVYAQTDSTNNRAADAGRNGAASGLVIFAEEQTAGRGRFGRAWASASHLGLWFSVLLRPPMPMARWPRLTTWTAVQLARVIDAQTGGKTQIKWPNDIYLNGRKAGGILIETGVDAAQAPFAVIGIGLNVNQTPDDLPEELRGRATSIREAAGRRIDRPEFAAAVLQQLDTGLPGLISDFAAIIEEATQRSTLIGQWVEINTGASVIQGTATGLDPEGQLLLRTGDGALQSVSAGEATLQARQ